MEAFKALPPRSSGGLFYDHVPDENLKGHNKTLLSLIQKRGPIVPDGQLKDVKKCGFGQIWPCGKLPPVITLNLILGPFMASESSNVQKK